MAIYLFYAYFVGHFCFPSNGKSKINANIVHLGYQMDTIGEKQLQRGPNLPLMQVALSSVEKG